MNGAPKIQMGMSEFMVGTSSDRTCQNYGNGGSGREGFTGRVLASDGTGVRP
jgi:hypothetical protein